MSLPPSLPSPASPCASLATRPTRCVLYPTVLLLDLVSCKCLESIQLCSLSDCCPYTDFDHYLSTAPDPLVAAPFQAGDFITYSGYRLGDELIVHNIVAQNVQINTLGSLAYLRMDVILLGISNPSGNAELAESRVSPLHGPSFLSFKYTLLRTTTSCTS